MQKQRVKEEGLAEGLKKGIKKKGKQEGIKEGKIEEKKQIALNMKSQGFDENTIAKCLNISIDDLNLLLNSK